MSFSAVDPASGERGLRRRSLADGLGIWLGGPDEPGLDGLFVRARSAIAGLEYLWPARDLVAGGMWLDLGPYDYRVYLDWATIRDADGRWARLHASFGGRGVPSLDDALRDMELSPLHEALAAVLGMRPLDEELDTDELDEDPFLVRSRRVNDLVHAVRDAAGARGGRSNWAVNHDVTMSLMSAEVSAEPWKEPPEIAAMARSLSDPQVKAAFRAFAVIAPLGALGDSPDRLATAEAWFQQLRLGPAVDRAYGPAGGIHEASHPPRVAHLTWLLLRLARATTPVAASGKEQALRLGEAWIADPDIAEHLDVHVADGRRWMSADRFDDVVGWTQAVALSDLVRSARFGEVGTAVDGHRTLTSMRRVAAAAGYDVDRFLDRLRKAATDGAATGNSSRRSSAAKASVNARQVEPARLVALFEAVDRDLASDRDGPVRKGPAREKRSRDYERLIDEPSRTDPRKAWAILNVLVDGVDDEELDGGPMDFLGAGLVEDFVRLHGPEYLDELEEAARGSARWRRALRGAWGWSDPDEIDERVARRLEPIIGGGLR